MTPVDGAQNMHSSSLSSNLYSQCAVRAGGRHSRKVGEAHRATVGHAARTRASLGITVVVLSAITGVRVAEDTGSSSKP